MQQADSLPVAANFVLMGLGFLVLSFGAQKTRYYAAAVFFAAAVVGAIHLSKFDVSIPGEWLGEVSIVVGLLLVVLAMINYARLQLREEVDVEDSVPSGGNGPRHFG
jgi:4-amino-4-deoxy-L-arabinose transferase-like glycosyltransferase